MSRKTSAISAALASAFGLVAESAIAQQAQPEYEMIMEEVIVTAPRVLRREAVGRTASGATIERISLTRRVSYADLDLKLHADVMELERRVTDMAKEACAQLDEIFPLGNLEPSALECAEDAAEEAMVRVREAVAAAR